MHFKYRLPLAIFATVVVALGHLHAEGDDDDEEDEFAGLGFFSRSPQTLKVGMNLTQGPKVQFGNLGNMPTILPTPVAGAARVYNDGTVLLDAPRPYVANDPTSEFDSENRKLSTNGVRYAVYSATDPSLKVGDYLSYADGVTRHWSYDNASQVTTHNGVEAVAFDIYSATTQGASLSGSRGYSGGVELSVARAMTNPVKRLSVSIVAGLSLNGINSSRTGTVNATLHTYTDFFSLNGKAAPSQLNADGTMQTAGVIWSGPSFININGVNTEASSLDPAVNLNTTLTIPNSPYDSQNTTAPNPTQVSGLWKIRGAYFTLKVGPQLTANLTRSLSMNASLGLAGSYVGSTYSATESFVVTGITNLLTTGLETSAKNAFLPGYYADVDANWALNERTGFFAGFSYDNLGSYNQSVGGRTAKIDLSATAGVHGGLSIKF